jgi:large subunit ribosomal protein L9
MKRSHRQVSVILNQDVEGLGFAGELLTVKAGYARHFLLAAGLADLATPERQAKRAAETAKAAAKREAEVAKLQATATALTDQPLALTLKIGPDGRVFGSITAAAVVKALKAERDLAVTTHQLSGLPLKALGTQTVSVKLGLGVIAALTIKLTGERTEPEAAPKTKSTA